MVNCSLQSIVIRLLQQLLRDAHLKLIFDTTANRCFKDQNSKNEEMVQIYIKSEL